MFHLLRLCRLLDQRLRRHVLLQVVGQHNNQQLPWQLLFFQLLHRLLQPWLLRQRPVLLRLPRGLLLPRLRPHLRLQLSVRSKHVQHRHPVLVHSLPDRAVDGGRHGSILVLEPAIASTQAPFPQPPSTSPSTVSEPASSLSQPAAT